MPKVKEKTFWVQRGEMYYWMAREKKDVKRTTLGVNTNDGKKLFGRMKFDELKQFKITEVKK